MGTGSAAEALERQHHEIDEEIEAFAAEPSPGRSRPGMQRAIHLLRRHIYAEEQFLFPPLFAAGWTAPVAVMLREHARIWKTLDSLDHAMDLDARDVVRVLVRQLAVQLVHHNLNEERVLYPQADVALSTTAAAHLREFLDAGELPAGWVCIRARTSEG
jgi:regulator of cell morphogenesis and NO signaling